MRRLAPVLACVVLTTAVLALYAPVLGFTLIGDDYQWFQLAHRAIHRPALLLADLDTFWRPSSTWTLAATHLVVPFSAEGHHVVSLALYLVAALLLLAVARKAGLGLLTSTAVALIWACSPFTSEPALSVASRHETLLLASWLALALVWPRAEQRWSHGRIAGAVACTLVAACSKETWVVTPALVFVYDLAIRRTRPRAALRPALLFAGPALAFTVARFAFFPTLRGYFSFSPSVLAKVPHEFAAFLHFEELLPVGFTFTWRGALAIVVVAGLAALGLRASRAATTVGLVLLVVPTIPTLLVPYLPTRYTAIPYAGFLLLAAAAAEAAIRGARPRVRPAAVACVGAVAAVVLAAGVVTGRADLVDGARFSAAHARLLREAAAVAPAFPLDRPVLVVRAEANNPAREIVMNPHGLPKIIFVRQPDPDGLIDAAALFEWVLEREDVAVVRYDDGEARFRGRPGAILEHRRDGFVWLTMDAPDLGAQAQRARFAGLRYRVLIAERLSTQPGGGAAAP
jgi:hypothetical protein